MVACLGETLASRDFRAELRALGSIIIKYWVRSIAQEFGYRSKLGVWLCDSVGENDTLEVDLPKSLSISSLLNLLVLLMDDRRDVGCIVATIGLGGDVKVGVGVLREAHEE